MHIAGLSHTSLHGTRPQVTTIGGSPILLNEKELRKKPTLATNEDDDVVTLEKSNILMLGPTGSGMKEMC